MQPMTNIAGQTRDETQRLSCPKCKAAMEKVSFGGVTVDRCVSCKGLWFDASEREQLRDLQVPSLSATVAGSTVMLAEPVAISDVAGLQRLLASISDPAASAGGPAPASVKTALRAQGDR